MTRRRAAMTTVLILLILLSGGVSACTSGPDDRSGPPGAGLDDDRALSIGRRFAQCAREHGFPDMPDPQVQDGKLVWPAQGPDLKEKIRTIMEQNPECKAIMDESMSLGDSRDNPTPSAEDLQKLQAFAKCMRDNGVDGFPDPKPDGTFPLLGTPLEHEGKSERVLAGIDACKHLYDKKIAVS